MAKKIPIYKDIDSYSAIEFINALNDAERFGEDVDIHISTNGGDVEQSFSMLIRIQEFANKKSMVVDGRAYSAGAIMCLYSDNAECYDVSQFMLHRASYGKWYEESEYFTESQRKRLDTINSIFKKKMKSKLNEEEFEKVAKMTIDEFFEGEQKDVQLTAQQAKKIGLISNIRKLDAVAKMEINSFCEDAKITAIYKEVVESPQATANSQTNNKSINMTIDEMKKDHPELVKALKDEFEKDAKSTIDAWAEWKEVDPEAVIEGISSMKAPTTADYSKLQKVMAKSGLNLATLEKEAPEASGAVVPETGTPETPAPTAKSGKDLMADYLASKGL